MCYSYPGMKRASPILIALALSGCYDVARFYPAPGEGQLVRSVENFGAAYKLSKDVPGARSFLVLTVRSCYTAAAEGRGRLRTVVHVTADLVNGAAAPAKFVGKDTRLVLPVVLHGGREVSPRWTYRSPGKGEEVPPQSRVRFDLFFDLGAYSDGAMRSARLLSRAGREAPGGVRLADLKGFSVTWKAMWAGRVRDGSTDFTRTPTGSLGGGWVAAEAPYWGWGWWEWTRPHPFGGAVVIHGFPFPWRYPRRTPLLKRVPLKK